MGVSPSTEPAGGLFDQLEASGRYHGMPDEQRRIADFLAGVEWLNARRELSGYEACSCDHPHVRREHCYWCCDIRHGKEDASQCNGSHDEPTIEPASAPTHTQS